MMIPEGQYEARLVQAADESGKLCNVQWGLSKSGNRQILINFAITSGPQTGVRMPYFGVFTKDTSKRLIESLRYMGFTGDDLLTLNDQPLNQLVIIDVRHSEYEGKTRARIEWINNYSGGAKFATPMSADDVRKFAAMVKANVAAVPETKGPTLDTVPPPAAGPAQSTTKAPAVEPPLEDGFATGDPMGPGGREPGSDDDIDDGWT